jgi:hypothetical protein
MASKAQIDRIAARIEALRPRNAIPFVAIQVRFGESKSEAQERHYRERPQDRAALETLFIERVIVNPAPQTCLSPLIRSARRIP